MKKRYSAIIFILFFSLAMADNSNWMAQISDQRQLNQLIIPGTHDSGTNSITANSAFSTADDDALPSWLQDMMNILPSDMLKKIVVNWSKTQPLNITDQLNQGARYLDFRVSNETNGFYLSHTLVGDALQDALQAVHNFVLQHPSEIILIDINHVYNVKNADAENALIQLIQKNLQGQLISTHYHTTDTLSTLRQSGGNIILLMDITQPIVDPTLNTFATQYCWPQSNIHSPWPNVQNSAALKSTLDAEMALRDKTYENSVHFFVMQAIKTEDTTQVIDGILNPNSNPNDIQRYELPVNNVLPTWATGYETQYGNGPVNIVIQDWFDQSNTIVNLAIQYDTAPPTKRVTKNNRVEKIEALKKFIQSATS